MSRVPHSGELRDNLFPSCVFAHLGVVDWSALQSDACAHRERMHRQLLLSTLIGFLEAAAAMEHRVLFGAVLLCPNSLQMGWLGFIEHNIGHQCAAVDESQSGSPSPLANIV